MSFDPNRASAAVVRHISKDMVTITPAEGYSVTLFKVVGGNVEALVAADDGSETFRLLVAGPGLDRTMTIKTTDGVTYFVYAKKEPNAG
jgi:hypothetical protein